MFVTVSLTTGFIVSAVLTVLILVSLANNPRIWIQDAPQEMQAVMTPLTAQEKRVRILWAIPIFAVALIPPFAALAWYQAAQQPLGYWQGVLFLWLVMMTFNVIDLLLIDWLIVVWWHPSWTMLPEVEHLNHLNNYAFHFKAFLKGTVGITLFALIGGLVVWWL
ncbi:MAG: hypothetical protein KDE51_09690 [Anaerolineales bacterium]|nr:hypothetical protein [Anaerolineales bacterium]